MSSSSSLASEMAFLDDSDEEQEEDEDMVLACVLVGKYSAEKEERPNLCMEKQNSVRWFKSCLSESLLSIHMFALRLYYFQVCKKLN